MATDGDISTFKYFTDQYIHGINAGGTFKLEELVELFEKQETPRLFERLLLDASYLKQVLAKEDWEIDSAILDFVLKNGGKNRFRKIVGILPQLSRLRDSNPRL
jgi:hypothetical protein